MKLTKRTLLALCIDDFDIRMYGSNLYIFINGKYLLIDSTGLLRESVFPQCTITRFEKPIVETYRKLWDKRLQ